MTENLYPIAFAAGLLSFFSPCIIPMISVYFTLITGLSIDELEGVDRTALRKSIFIKTMLFVLAFIIVFTLAGGAAGQVGKVLQQQMWVFNLVGGLFITLLGLKMMGLLNLAFVEKLNLERYISINKGMLKGRNQYLTAFLVGLFFALACSHCIGPTLYSVLIAAGAAGSTSGGMLVMFLFSIGLAIPYLLVALSIGAALNFLKKLGPYKKVIGVITGGIMIFFGVMIMLDKFTVITGFFFKLLPYKLPIGM
ncbi:MAG: sulfite exporter TauE/SafE family protein [Clostridia bacterium]|nr:sulfite exporter TauE/SafE family protein [Clostridia bacterium]